MTCLCTWIARRTGKSEEEQANEQPDEQPES